MARRHLRAALLALALSACTSELDVPPDIRLTCPGGSCPAGFTCVTTVDPPICVLSDQLGQAPDAVGGGVQPPVARVGVEARVTFTVTKALAEDPAVSLAITPPRALVKDAAASSGNTYVYVYSPVGDEPQAQDLLVRADLKDAQGQTAAGRTVGQLRFDFSIPAISSVVLTGSPARSAGQLRLSFTASEPLSADPVVRVGGAPLTKEGTSTPPSYTYGYVSSGTESEDPAGLPITVDLVDAGGNTATGIVAVNALFDRTPPALSAPATVLPPAPGAAAIGTLVRTTFTANEDLGTDPVVSLGAAGMDKGAQSGRTYTYGHVVVAGDGEGTKALSLALEDLAGNTATVAGPDVVLDFGPPAIGAVTLCAADGTATPCAAPAATFSAQPGHDQAKLTFTLSEDAAVVVTVGTEVLPPSACTTSGFQRVCTFTVTDPAAGANPRVETAGVYVQATDGAGNRALATTFATLDFKPPALAGQALLERCDAYGPARLAQDDLWTKPLASFGCRYMVSAGQGAVRVTFTVDEPLASPQAVGLAGVVLDDGTAFWPDPSNLSTTQFVAVLPVDPAEGTRQVLANVADTVGNTARIALGTLRVDLTPPAPPTTTTAGAIRYQRFPWGADATRGAKAFYLAGATGSVTPFAQVVAYDGDDPTRASTLGRTTAAVDGSFGGPAGSTVAFDIPSGNVPEVFVAQEDPAGNSSAAALVWDGEWIATPGYKIPGDTTANPGVLATDPAWRAAVRYAPTQLEPPNAGQLGASNQTLLSTTGAPDFRDLTPDAGVPVARGLCAAAWDADLGRLVVHGGLSAVRAGGSFNTTWYGDTWTWDGARWTQLQTSGAPGARSGHVLVHDPVRQRTVLFGGAGDTGQLRDTWLLSGSRWTRACFPGCVTGTECTCTQSPPSLGFAFWDPTGNRVVGVTASGPSQTWSWDGLDWTQLAPAQPLPVAATRIATSPELSTSLALVSGSGTWTWNGSNWVGPSALPPFDTTGHEFVFSELVTFWDPTLARYVAWDPYPNQLFTWTGTAWNAAAAPAAAPFDSTFSSCGGYDRSDGAYVRFGGCFTVSSAACNVPEGGVRNTTVRVTPGSAVTLSPGTMPAARRNAGMADVRDEGSAWMVQGIGTDVDPYSDDWSWNGHRWTARGSSPVNFVDVPISWLGPGRTIQYGGTPTGPSGFFRIPPFTFVRTAPGNAWTTAYLDPEPDPPSGSVWGDQALAWHPSRGAVYFRPRSAGAATWSATWVDTPTPGILWTPWPGATAPGSVAGHRMAYCASAGGIVLFGGTTGGGALLDETWRWNGTSWSQLAPPVRPPRRANHVLFCDERRDKIFVVGGNGAAGPLDDVWQFDGTTWVELAPALRPEARRGAAGAFLSAKGRGVVFGGLGSGLFGDTWDVDGGRDRKPAHLYHAPFAAASTGPVALTGIGATWAVMAASVFPESLPATFADLQVRDGEVWRSVGGGNFAGAPITWSTETDPAFAGLPPQDLSRRLRGLLAGDRLDLSLAATPHGVNDTRSPGAVVETRYVEARVRYRLSCLAAGARTSTAQRCCSGSASGTACQ